MDKLPANISEEKDRRGLDVDTVELVRQRLGFLKDKDRILLSMYYVDGCSFRRMAGLLRVNECNLSRRIRRLTRRLLSGQYVICLRNRRLFGPAELRIAKDYYVNGKTVGQIAANSGSSSYEVRKKIERIEAVLELLGRMEGKF